MGGFVTYPRLARELVLVRVVLVGFHLGRWYAGGVAKLGDWDRCQGKQVKE